MKFTTRSTIPTDASTHAYAIERPARYIDGPVTLNKLNAWIAEYRPEIALYDNAGMKGFYRVDSGPTMSSQQQGESWRDVAAALGALPEGE